MACNNTLTGRQEENMPNVLITGANRGLGFKLATQYAALGWRVLAGQAAGNHGFREFC